MVVLHPEKMAGQPVEIARVAKPAAGANEMTRAFAAVVAAAAVALAALIPSPAGAQAYPTKPVRIIVPFGAGGTTDIMGRILAQKLSDSLGQRFVIENKPGAGGNVGADIVAKAPADGYTLGMGTVSSHAINATLYATIPYNNLKDFAPISLMITQPNALVVTPSFPAKTLAEVVAALKAKPDGYSYASSGIGTSIHMAAELLKLMSGTQMAHVPYKSSAEVMTATISGEVQLAFDNLSSVVQHVQEGRLRIIGVTSPERSFLMPDVPTIRESLPGFEATSWTGFYAPAATPRAIVELLSRETQKAVRQPDVTERLRAMGATPVGNTPAEFTAFMEVETKKWADVVKASGAKVE
jgi:tripartite-type tricarboxylate transporter receptor subunit TctC